MKLFERILNGANIRETLLGYKGMYEMANASKRDTGLPYNLWVDSVGSDRNAGHSLPRLKVEFEDGKLTPVTISSPVRVLKAKVPKGANTREVYKFIQEHQAALTIHYYREWSDTEILIYLLLVGRKKKSKREAIQYMLDNDIIDKIPKEFKSLFKN